MFDDDDEDQIPDARELPIFKKGEEIYKLAKQITDLISDEDEMLMDIKSEILLNSRILCVKVVGAEAGGLYDLKMEAAAIIRKAARELIIAQHSLRSFGFKEHDYFNMIRELVEEYRLLFIDWVSGFDQWDYVIDRWGLFNPPGVGPFDKDPDDDIPFNPEDYLNNNID